VIEILPDKLEREELVSLLIIGEILTRRGETGPLARLWRPALRPCRQRTEPLGAGSGDMERVSDG
jgi:hypothetical protein